MAGNACSVNPLLRWIRVALALVIIAWGIWHWKPFWYIAVLGVIPLITAFTGQCGFSLKPRRSIHEENDGQG